MAIDVNNYAQRLASARDRYDDALRETKDSHSKEISDKDKLHERSIKKRQANYMDNKRELENRLEHLSDHYSETLREKVKGEKGRFRGKLEEAKSNFERDRLQARKNYRRKLGDAIESYNASKESMQMAQEEEAKELRERLVRGIKEAQGGYRKKAENLKKESIEQLRDFQSKVGEEKKRQALAHELEKQKLIQGGNKEKGKLKQAFEREMNRMREVHNSVQNQTKSRNQARTSQIIHAKNKELSDIRDRFDSVVNKIARESRDDVAKMEDYHLKERSELENRMVKNQDKWEEKLNRILGERGGDNERSKIRELSDVHHERLSRLRNAMEKRDIENEAFSRKLSEKHMDEAKVLKTRHRKNLEEKDIRFRKYIHEDVADLKRGHQRTVEQYIDKYYNAEEARHKEVAEARSKMEHQKKLSKERFANQLESLGQKSMEAVKEVKDSYVEEQNKIVMDSRRRLHNEMEGLRGDLYSNYALREEQMQKKIEAGDHKLENIVKLYERRLDRFRDKARKEIENLVRVAQDQRIEDKRSFKQTLTKKDREFNKIFRGLKRDFDKQLAKVKHTADARTEKMIKRYEQRLERERSNHIEELRIKLGLAKTEYDRLFNKSELEKESIIGQYESRMDALRQARS